MNAARIETMILSPQNRPTRRCHAVTLAETPSGLIAAWFGGQIESASDSGIWLARQSAAGWSRPVEIIAGPSGSQGGDADSICYRYIAPYPCWNPVLFKPREGALLLFYKVGRSPRLWQGWLTRSSDDGQTWCEPCPLGDSAIGALLGPVKNKPVQRPDGVILCPSSTESREWRTHIEATRDMEHWEVFGPVDDPNRLGAIQPTLLSLPDGRMLMLCRTKHRIIARSESSDGGQTWSPLAPTALNNPNSGIDAVTLNDGRLLLVYNDSDCARTPLVAAISEDGEHWRNTLTLEDGPGEYSYPAVIQSANGKVHIAYTWRRQGIGYAVIEPAKAAS